MRWDVGAQVMRVVGYAHFALNKFESQRITLSYNALALIIFDHAFHTSSTKPNPCTNFSHNHNMHSRLQHSLVKFLNIKSRYSLSHISHERYHFWSRRSYLTSENDNKIYLSPTPRPFVLGVRYEPHPRGIYSKFLWLDSWSSLWAHPIDITFGFFQT